LADIKYGLDQITGLNSPALCHTRRDSAKAANCIEAAGPQEFFHA